MNSLFSSTAICLYIFFLFLFVIAYMEETRINFDNQIVKKTITYSEMDALEAHLEYVKQELNNPRLDLSFGIRRLF